MNDWKWIDSQIAKHEQKIKFRKDKLYVWDMGSTPNFLHVLDVNTWLVFVPWFCSWQVVGSFVLKGKECDSHQREAEILIRLFLSLSNSLFFGREMGQFGI